MTRLRKIFWTIILLMLIASGVLYYAYQNAFNVPAPLLNRIRTLVKDNSNLDFSAETLKINVRNHSMRARGLKLMAPGHKPFAEIEEAIIYFASGTGPLDFYHSRVLIEKISVMGLIFDPVQQQPSGKAASNTFNVPAREIFIENVKIKTPFMTIDAPDLKAQLLKSGKNANVNVDLGANFLGGTGRIVSVVDLAEGFGRSRFNWKLPDFSSFMPLMMISHLYGVSVGKGSAEIILNWEGNLSQRIKQPKVGLVKFLNQELKGSINIKDCDLKWSGISGKLDLLVSREEAKPWNLNASLVDDKARINLSATWLGKEGSLKDFTAQIRGENILLNDKVINGMGVTLANTLPGELNFAGDFVGSSGKVTGAGFAKGRNWKYQEKLVENADLKWAVDENFLLSSDGSLKTEIGNLVASAGIFIGGPEQWVGKVEGTLQKIDLQSLRPFIESPVAGKCSGPFLVKFNLLQPASTSYDLSLEMNDGGFYSFKPSKLTTRIFGVGTAWNLENPVAVFADSGEIRLDGQVNSRTIAGKIKVDQVDLRNFNIPERFVSAFANLTAEISGPLTRPFLKGEVWGDNVTIMGLHAESFKAQLIFKEDLLTLAPMVAKVSDEAMVDGFFSWNLLSGKIKTFKLGLQQLPLTALERFLPSGISGNDDRGVVGGTVSFKESKGQNNWEFALDGRNLVVKEQELDSVSIEGNILGRQGEIKSLFVRAFGGTINLSGQFYDQNKFSGTMEAETLQLDRIKPVADFLPDMHGEINCQGGIDWSSEDRSGSLTMFVRNMKTMGRELGNFGGQVSIDKQGVKISSGEFDQLGIKIDGKIDWAGKKTYKAELSLENSDLSFIPEAHGIKTFDFGGLVVTGHCALQGDLEAKFPEKIDFAIDALRIQKQNDVIVSNRPMQILYQNEGIEIRSLELKYRLGIIGIEGIIAPGKTMAIMLSGKDFSLKALGRLFDLPNWNYDGSLSLNARVFGDMQDLKLKASANIDELVIGGKKIPAVWAKVEGDSRGIKIEEAKVSLPSSSFNLNGNIELSSGFRPEKIDLHLFIPSGPLTDFPEYLPTVFREASGTIKADLNLVGGPFNPQITGDLKLTADQLAFSNMRKPLTNVVFSMSTTDRIINIDELSAHLGRGKLSGHGNVDFRDNLGSITANISGEKLDMSFMNLEVTGASASADISGDLYNPVIKGKVLVPRGKFNITTDLLAKRKKIDLFFESLNYHVDVEVPRNFWIKNSFLNAEMRGKFSIAGDLENIKLDGGVSCVQGNLFFRQRKFLIETGEIRFGGVDNSLDPQIFVKSEGQIQSTKIFLTLQGRISSFTPKIYSTPPMSEGDLLAMLTLGRDLNSAMNTDSKELFESEILDGLKNSYISALIGNTISSALNLDELFLSSLFDRSSGKSKSFIRVGKYIGRNIFMAYEGTMYENEEETYIFEYRLPKGFVVNLEFKEPTKEQRIGVRYDWKFW